MNKAQKVYEGFVDFHVENNSHTKVFQLMNQEEGIKKKVLEVGCSQGYFGAALKDKGYEVWGVEPSDSSVKKAEKYLDHVHHGFVQDFFSENKGVMFDYITFGDVVEHLYDPVEVLEQCKEFLSPKGSLICSIPNVSHMSVRVLLLEGRWEYTDLGILDDTHVRFYTRNSIASLLARSGYELISIDSVRLTAEVASDLCKMDINLELLAEARKLVKDEDQDVFQFITKAVPSNKREKLLEDINRKVANRLSRKILCVVPFYGSSLIDIRLINPLRKWKDNFGGELRCVDYLSVCEEDAKWADVSVFAREANALSVSSLHLMHSHAVPVIFDIDDLLTEVPIFLSVHEHCEKHKPFLIKMLGSADVVTTTTLRLSEQLQKSSSNVTVIENGANAPDQLTIPKLSKTGKISLIVASSDTIRLDFIGDALLEIIRLYKDKNIEIEVVGVGPPGKWLHRYGIPVNQLDNMSYVEFIDFLKKQDNAIGVIPLDDSLFSSCKSPIKYIDYSFAGIPSICSKYPPYSDYIVHNTTGLLVENESSAWVDNLSSLINSMEKRQSILNEAWGYCHKNFTMNHVAQKWDNVISEVSSKHIEVHNRPVLPAYIVQKVGLKHLLLDPETYKKIIESTKNHGVIKTCKKAVDFIKCQFIR